MPPQNFTFSLTVGLNGCERKLETHLLQCDIPTTLGLHELKVYNTQQYASMNKRCNITLHIEVSEI